jgi:hypothetical protein
MDKYELLPALMICGGRRKRKRSTSRHLRKAQNANFKWMLKAAAEKLAASTQQLRAKIHGLGGGAGFNWMVNGAISFE